MSWKKAFSLVLVLSIVFLMPFTKGYAEEENPDEIINREDTPTSEDTPSSEDIPDPPKDESLIGEEEDVHEVEIETPSSVTGEKTEGAGTVVDFSTNGAKAFYTIADNDNNTFYLIIDMDKADNNVYFLSEINQGELEGSSAPENNDTALSNSEDEQAAETNPVNSEELKDTEEEGSSNLGFLITVVSIGVVGALGYHFLIKNRRKNKNTSDGLDDDEDDEMLEGYEDDEMYSEQDSLESENEGEQHNESDNK